MLISLETFPKIFTAMVSAQELEMVNPFNFRDRAQNFPDSFLAKYNLPEIEKALDDLDYTDFATLVLDRVDVFSEWPKTIQEAFWLLSDLADYGHP